MSEQPLATRPIGPYRQLLGLAQKAGDFLDFVHQRARMLARFHVNRFRQHLALRGRVERILIVRLASIGDVVRASAVVLKLRQQYPDAAIDFLTARAALPVIRHNPALNAVYSLEDLPRLGSYDWVINLQNRTPPDSFLGGSGLDHTQVLEHLSTRIRCRFFSGRRINRGSETTPTNVLYCSSEMEELFLIALLRFDPHRYPLTRVCVDEGVHAAVRQGLRQPTDRPAIGLFLGSNSPTCGADEGYRTYSIEYLNRLISRFHDRFTIVVVGQSQMKSASEMDRYRDILRHYPDVVDLVDRTSLDELISVIAGLQLLITCDSSPVHVALACDVPVVGLYVNDATFRMTPALSDDRFICLNSTPPCFNYSWRWRFFCGTCRDPRTRAQYCHHDAFTFGVDRISIDLVDDAVSTLLHRAGRG